MKKLEITRENIEIYQDFLDTKRRYPLTEHRMLWDLGILSSNVVLLLGGFVGSCYIVKGLSDLFAYAMLSTYSIVFLLLSFKLTPKIVDFILIKKFQRKYPDFNVKLDEEEVEEALKECDQVLGVSKDVKEFETDYLADQTKCFCQVTTREKLEFLKEEVVFYQQALLEEEHRNLENDVVVQSEIMQEKKLSKNR